MLFNVAFFSSLLFSPVVLALPPGLGARIARRGESSQANNLLEGAMRINTSAAYYTSFAGALWSEGNGTFDNITATITVPHASGTNGSSAAFSVGIDGVTCSGVLLATGFSVMVGELGSVTYSAWYSSLPTYLNTFPDPIKISAGDTLKLTANTSSLNSATLTIENLSNGQLVSKSLNSLSLCGKDAEWGVTRVRDYGLVGAYYPLADFGTVTFTNATAIGEKHWYPFASKIIDMEPNGTVLTNVTVEGLTSLGIQYL